MDRSLTKINNNKFELKIYDKKNDLRTIHGFSKKALKDIYSELQANKNGLLANQAQHKAKLKKINVEDNNKLRDFIKMSEAAQQLQQKTQIEDQLKMINADILNSISELKEIRLVCPEFGRVKK